MVEQDEQERVEDAKARAKQETQKLPDWKLIESPESECLVQWGHLETGIVIGLAPKGEYYRPFFDDSQSTIDVPDAAANNLPPGADNAVEAVEQTSRWIAQTDRL